MLGPIITAGIGAAAFRLGMEANRLAGQGKNCCEIARSLGQLVVSDVSTACGWCHDKVSSFMNYPPNRRRN